MNAELAENLQTGGICGDFSSPLQTPLQTLQTLQRDSTSPFHLGLLQWKESFPGVSIYIDDILGKQIVNLHHLENGEGRRDRQEHVLHRSHQLV